MEKKTNNHKEKRTLARKSMFYEKVQSLVTNENLENVLTENNTFSTTDVSLKVRYNPVISDEKRLPYSLFKKKRYQTGVGSNARYSSSRYSTNVSI